MSITERVHESIVFDRRIRVLARHLSQVIPRHVSVLDVGCGYGLLARSIGQLRPDLAFQGIEVLLRPETHIEVDQFDGSTIPFSEFEFDDFEIRNPLRNLKSEIQFKFLAGWLGVSPIPRRRL